jgi:hypothetical protein
LSRAKTAADGHSGVLVGIDSVASCTMSANCSQNGLHFQWLTDLTVFVPMMQECSVDANVTPVKRGDENTKRRIVVFFEGRFFVPLWCSARKVSSTIKTSFFQFSLSVFSARVREINKHKGEINCLIRIRKNSSYSKRYFSRLFFQWQSSRLGSRETQSFPRELLLDFMSCEVLAFHRSPFLCLLSFSLSLSVFVLS